MRVLLILISSLAFGLVAKPEKDFQLYCVYNAIDKHAIFKYRIIDGVSRMIGTELYISGYKISKGTGIFNEYNNSPEYEDFELEIDEYILVDEDEDKYYFGDPINVGKIGNYLRYEIELNRKTLGINFSYECDFIDDESANESIKLWREWEKEWQLKYPKPIPPKNKI